MEERKEPRASFIARDLRESILTGEIQPGARLPQEDLAERYHASRVPVQSALRELAAEGLVTLIPNAGARVAPFDLSELVELYRAREALEPMVLAQSVPRLTDEDIDRIESLVAETEACAARGDRLAYVEADYPLHLATFQAAGIKRVMRVIEGFWGTTQQYRRIYGLFPMTVEISVTEHRLLLDLIKSRNANDAAQLLGIHIRRTRHGLAEHVAARQGTFSEDAWPTGAA
ncbi:MAG TPA: GntR family transcriptional regulator [Chloroflexota bacterium]|jgi:DNA-binding GntR family transcriptional regulator|nr:GntR family transcriptional regulator [Chloroflexota bacterium]